MRGRGVLLGYGGVSSVFHPSPEKSLSQLNVVFSVSYFLTLGRHWEGGFNEEFIFGFYFPWTPGL